MYQKRVKRRQKSYNRLTFLSFILYFLSFFLPPFCLSLISSSRLCFLLFFLHLWLWISESYMLKLYTYSPFSRDRYHFHSSWLYYSNSLYISQNRWKLHIFFTYLPSIRLSSYISVHGNNFFLENTTNYMCFPSTLSPFPSLPSPLSSVTWYKEFPTFNFLLHFHFTDVTLSRPRHNHTEGLDR